MVLIKIIGIIILVFLIPFFVYFFTGLIARAILDTKEIKEKQRRKNDNQD